MRTRDEEILQAVYQLQHAGMRTAGRNLIEVVLKKNLRISSIRRLSFLGYLQGDEELGWSLTAKGAEELERRGHQYGRING